MIRKATAIDMFALVEMMRGYVAEAPMETLKDVSLHNQRHIEELLSSLIAGRGFILIDEDCRGFIAAMTINNVWCPSICELHELAWWVNPNHREGTVGGRLWKSFDAIAQEFLDCGRAQIICTSLIANSPTINYEKRGYKLMQKTYFKEL
jgi:hypothetical protein